MTIEEMMAASAAGIVPLPRQIEPRLREWYDSERIFVRDGDVALLADTIAQDLEGVTGEDLIRQTVKTSCYEQYEEGLLWDPEIHTEIAEIVLARQ
ncbi:hypothetical protein [Saccharopolyspora griseoalba]|uniref:Uncharacterized protein n=1 Tax=Saccharopolyspora griseoalba TaxID=1431848 RepID=A0ABW2LTL6_9PSEU